MELNNIKRNEYCKMSKSTYIILIYFIDRDNNKIIQQVDHESMTMKARKRPSDQSNRLADLSNAGLSPSVVSFRRQLTPHLEKVAPLPPTAQVGLATRDVSPELAILIATNK